MTKRETIKAKKKNMTQIWHEDRVVPVTVLEVNEKGSLSELLGGLKKNDKVDVIGTSKGKGFQGVVKRHGFGGGPKSHGQKDRLRAPGSLGPTAPQRTLKGRKMAGHMGNRRVTIIGLKIAQIKEEERIIAVKGAIPGHRNAEVNIRKSSR